MPDQTDPFLPPHDLDAERCVIASIVLDPDCLPDVLELVDASDMYQPDHRIIFAAAVARAQQGQLDIVLLRDELTRRGQLEEVGGVIHLTEIVGTVPSATHAAAYARTVRDCSMLRRIATAGRRMIDAATTRQADVADVLADALERLSALQAGHAPDASITTLGNAAARFIDAHAAGNGSSAIPTGWTDLDRAFRGIIGPGAYSLVAARPSVGKSTLIRQLVAQVARSGIAAGLIAVEEDEAKVASDALVTASGIDTMTFRHGSWSGQDRQAIDEAAGQLADLPVYLTDRPTRLRDVVAAVEIMHRRHGCKLVAIDHVNLIDDDRRENRTQQLTAISGELKRTFKRLGVAGVVAAQLSRPAERGSCPSAPHLTDLRDSGALEEHADAVLMLHREDAHRRDRDNYTPTRLLELYVRKHRGGPTGSVDLRADLARQRFLDLDASDDAGVLPDFGDAHQREAA